MWWSEEVVWDKLLVLTRLEVMEVKVQLHHSQCLLYFGQAVEQVDGVGVVQLDLHVQVLVLEEAVVVQM